MVVTGIPSHSPILRAHEQTSVLHRPSWQAASLPFPTLTVETAEKIYFSLSLACFALHVSRAVRWGMGTEP